MKFSKATLITTEGQLQVDGVTPRITIIDTGAGAIILGRSFARKINRCQFQYLAFGDTFVTAAGQETPSLGRMRLLLDFTLAKGTLEETKISSYTLIADTDAYDMILGMDFLGAVFGYLDPLTEEFLWRVDCRETKVVPSRLARLAATCRGTTEERRNIYTIKVITCSSDLQDAILGDESLGKEFENNVNMDSKARIAPMTTTCILTFAFMMQSHNSSLTSKRVVEREIKKQIQNIKPN